MPESGLPETSLFGLTPRLRCPDLRLLTLSLGAHQLGHPWFTGRGSKYSASQIPRAKVVAGSCNFKPGRGGVLEERTTALLFYSEAGGVGK